MNRYIDRYRYEDSYRDYDYDNDGYPGEFVYGDDVYIDDYYMDELWKPIEGIPGYWVSDKGRIYSNIKNKFIYGSPTGRCGHLDLSLRVYVNGRSYRVRMMVRHINDDPTNNCVENLAWGTQLDNTQDCIRNGHFRYFTDEDRELAMEKRRTPVTAVNLRTGDKTGYISQQSAARDLNISQGSIARVLSGRSKHANGYFFYYTNDPMNIDVNSYRIVRHRALIRAVNIKTGDVFIFKGQTEAARELGMSIASISNVLSNKQYSAKGYIFEYVDEEDYYDSTY